jgi:SecD/SecF fusion protein
MVQKFIIEILRACRAYKKSLTPHALKSKLQKALAGKVLIILLVTAGLTYLDSRQDFNLGLDLSGGTQLDYLLDLSEVEEIDREQIIEGTQEIIQKRVDALGVAEPQIYVSTVADETHVIVELAGIDDVEEAKEIVGKTIQLEFKELATEVTDEKIVWATEQADIAFSKLQAGIDFESFGEEQTQEWENDIRIDSQTDLDTAAANPTVIAALEGLEVGSTVGPIDGIDGYTLNLQGEVTELTGLAIYQLTDRYSQDEVVETEASASARHILIAYDGSQASSETPRTQEEAKTLADDLYARIQAGESLSDLAPEFSDDSTAENGGDLGNFGPGRMVAPFEEAAYGQEIGDVSQPVETVFGYHIIETYEKVEATSEDVTVDYISYNKISYSTTPDEWGDESLLTGEHFKHADVAYSQAYLPYVNIVFTKEGGDIFEAMTERNLGQPIAIFVGGELISYPTVQAVIAGGQAQISGNFTNEEALALARDLNTGAIPSPIELTGQYTISSTLGAEALDKSLNAGIIGLAILSLFMLAYYRLPGLLANIALVIYSIVLTFLITSALPVWVALVIGLSIFGYLVYLIMGNNDSGGEKMISFFIACVVLFFLMFVLSSPVTLTLAGIAGVILSIGMAVDANVLIFERTKEELRSGKDLTKAIEEGFKRAWDSIRDSNFSSLITCAILFYFGSSIIRGFALNLALGILVSMLSAILLTRTFLLYTANTPLKKNLWLFGKPKNKKQRILPIIQNTRIWAGISGTLMIASIISIVSFGINFGLDFTGGTLLEVQPKSEIVEVIENSDDLGLSVSSESTVLTIVAPEGEEITVEEAPETIAEEVEDTEPSVTLNAQEIAAALVALEASTEFDIGAPQVVTTDQGSAIIRIKHINEEMHDQIFVELESIYGELEEVRFTTVGPTIGKTLKKKAFTALLITLFMIVFYIAFAFRKIPKEVSPWRFGFSAIVALVHDILIVVGIFTLLGHTMDVEIDALFITALLTIMGFSVHDTIVVFDRVRENLIFRKDGEKLEGSANRALTQTMARSINTSISTLITIVALLVLGAQSIQMFVFALAIGILAGTYSSIFVASPLLVWWNNKWPVNRKKKR